MSFEFQLHTEQVPVPVGDGSKTVDLPMRVLTGAEDMQVKAATETEVKKLFPAPPKKDEVSNYEELYKDRFMYWTIFHAVRDPKDPKKRFFETIQMVNDLPVEVIAILTNHYLMIKLRQKYIQHLGFDNEDELQKVMDAMIANPQEPEFYLNFFSDLSMLNLLKFVVNKYSQLKQEYDALLSNESGEDKPSDPSK